MKLDEITIKDEEMKEKRKGRKWIIFVKKTGDKKFPKKYEEQRKKKKNRI